MTDETQTDLPILTPPLPKPTLTLADPSELQELATFALTNGVYVGWTHLALAKKLGIHKNTIGEIRTRTKVPTLSRSLDILIKLGWQVTLTPPTTPHSENQPPR